MKIEIEGLDSVTNALAMADEVVRADVEMNYPPIHPNCRCTTVMADFISKTHIARNPDTGKNYKADGSMTFEEWKESLTSTQRTAMKTHVKKYRAKNVDNSG